MQRESSWYGWMKTKFALIWNMKWFLSHTNDNSLLKGHRKTFKLIFRIFVGRATTFSCYVWRTFYCWENFLLYLRVPNILGKWARYDGSDSWSYMLVRLVWIKVIYLYDLGLNDKKERRKWRWARFFHPFSCVCEGPRRKKKNKRTNQLLDSQIMASPPDSPQPCLLPFIHTLPPQPAKIKDTSLYSPLHFIHCNKGHSRSTGLVPYAIPFNPSPVDS